MNYLNDIWKELLPMINWVIFAIVIGSGYFIRATPILKKISTTLKVFLFSLITTSAYTFYAEIEISIFISSYFISFGFHSAIIKLIEKLFYNKNTQSKLIGDRPDDR